MTNIDRIQRILGRFPLAAAMLYVLMIVVFVFATASTALDLLERRNAASAAADMLAQIEGRGLARAPAVATDVTVPAGSPFVEGATVSVAGATLMQRVASATTQAGGNVLSSQVDLQGSQSKAGFVTVTASFEIEPLSLQRLLYDLESGMPFLFVDQMVVQAPESAAAGGKTRVVMSVSGQWQGVK